MSITLAAAKTQTHDRGRLPALVVVASVVEKEVAGSAERDREEEVALAAVQEEVMSESEEKSHSAKRGTA
jgi:hypothetical protein